MSDLQEFCAQTAAWLDANAPAAASLFMKRARLAAGSFADAAHHRDRWPRLSGYGWR